MLDSVVVQADGKCPVMSYTGFLCRRRIGKGVYLTDDDLADKGAVELGEVFVDVKGFDIERRPTRFGLKPIPFAEHGGCINALVNGRPLAVTNQLPRYATELIAVEIYAQPRSVPEEYQRYVWTNGIRQSSPRVGPRSWRSALLARRVLDVVPVAADCHPEERSDEGSALGCDSESARSRRLLQC